MRFTVIWRPIADAQLSDLWSDHPVDRGPLADASEEISSLLRDDPMSKGRPFGVCRILIKPPIIALYPIDEGDRKVNVLQIKRF